MATSGEWGSAPQSPIIEKTVSEAPSLNGVASEAAADAEKVEKGEDKGPPVKKFRGIPEDVKLFEVFWHQVVELVKVCPVRIS